MQELDSSIIRYALKTAHKHGFEKVHVQEGKLTFKATINHDTFDEYDEYKELDLLSELDPTHDSLEFSNRIDLVAPMVGYYHQVEGGIYPGKRVVKGESLAIIVALGLPNDVKASHSGEIIEVLVEPLDAVEYGQVFARLRVE